MLTPEDCRRRREAHGLSPERLARIAGVAERTVTRFEESAVASRHGTRLALSRGLEAAEDAALQRAAS